MSPVLIQNVTLLVGKEFRKVESGNLLIRDGIIQQIDTKKTKITNVNVLDGENLLGIPGLIDAHTHIGDSFAKDVGVGKPLKELVHPLHGIKSKLLANESPATIREAISQTSKDMLSCGITTFADFREGGLEGLELAREALSKCKQRVLLLGRPRLSYSEETVAHDVDIPESVVEEAKKILAVSNGFGLSGANEYTNSSLKNLAKITRGTNKLLAIHAAESVEAVHFSNETFHETEIQRILNHMTPSFIVHMTHANEADIQRIAQSKVGIVCCPRANATLGVGVPPISNFLRSGIKTAIGTDNVMLNAPDMFRELDYAARIIKATTQDPSAITSSQALSMATTHAADILGLGSSIGSLEVGKQADIVFLDMNAANLSFSRDIVSSIVHRARPDNIECVMIQGEIVHGSIEK
jgi:cytosine/adenosine deaminase-related metal-dependent hydrolase